MDATALDAAVCVRQLPACHVAAPGRGVYAAAPLRARAPLLVYGGEVVRDEDAHATGYVFGMVATPGVACDGSAEPRCRAAYVNDARGSGVAPNCAFLEVVCGGGCHARGPAGASGSSAAAVPTRQPVHAHTVLCALRDIAPDEELLVSYGDSYWAPPASASCKVMFAHQPHAAPTKPAKGAAASSASSTRIDALNNELLLRVFSLLRCAEDLAAVAAVQPAWRALVRASPTLWCDVIFRPALALAPRPARRALAVAANAAGRLTSLDMRPLGDCSLLKCLMPGESDSDEEDDELPAAAAAAATVADEEEEDEEEEYVYELYATATARTVRYLSLRRKRIRNLVRFRAALARIAAANPGLRRVAVSASAVHDDLWVTAAVHSDVEYWAVAAPVWPRRCTSPHRFDGDTALEVDAMWKPRCLAALARVLPRAVALTADVLLDTEKDVRDLVALHGAQTIALDALTLSNRSNFTLDEDGEPVALLVEALTADGRLGLGLKHLVLHGSPHTLHTVHTRVLTALANGGAPALHTLELRKAQGELVRYVADLLQGDAAFALRRLTVLQLPGDASALSALAALTATLPPSLHTLVLHMQLQFVHEDQADAAAALRALLAAAATRCPHLRSVQLTTTYRSMEFVVACRIAVEELAAARPDVRTVYRAYTRTIRQMARKGSGILPDDPIPWWQL